MRGGGYLLYTVYIYGYREWKTPPTVSALSLASQDAADFEGLKGGRRGREEEGWGERRRAGERDCQECFFVCVCAGGNVCVCVCRFVCVCVCV